MPRGTRGALATPRRDTEGCPAGMLTQHTDFAGKAVRENHTTEFTGEKRRNSAGRPLEPSKLPHPVSQQLPGKPEALPRPVVSHLGMTEDA